MCLRLRHLVILGGALAVALVALSNSIAVQGLIAFLGPVSQVNPFVVKLHDPTYGFRKDQDQDPSSSWLPLHYLPDIQLFARGITRHLYSSILHKPIHYHATSGEHVSLGAWDLLTTGASCSKPNDAEINVLYSHGNAENRASSAHRYDVLAQQFAEIDRCARIVTYDYRGFGDSSGWASEENLAEDARNVLHKANLRPERTILFGHSLGTVVSMRLAFELVTNSTPPAAVVLEAPLTHAAGVCAAWLGGAFVESLMEPMEQICSAYAKVNMSTMARMQEGTIDFPVYIFHGVRDWTVPHAHGQTLHDLCVSNQQPSKRKSCEFYSFPEAGHLDIFEARPKVDLNGEPSTDLLRRALQQVLSRMP